MLAVLMLLALAPLAAVLSACGGHTSSGSEEAKVAAAIRSSPYTYFAYRDPLYWGRSVHMTISRVRLSLRDASFAGAVVTPLESNGKRASSRERVLLQRTDQWRVIRAQSFLEYHFACRLAPAGVINELFGHCDPSPFVVFPGALVSGPAANRPPTARERAASIAAFGPATSSPVRIAASAIRSASRLWTIASPRSGAHLCGRQRAAQSGTWATRWWSVFQLEAGA